MLNKKVALPIIAAVLMALGINLEKFGIDLNALLGGDVSQSSGQSSQVSGSSNSAGTTKYRSGSKWSGTSPEINLHHIFEGEINRKASTRQLSRLEMAISGKKNFRVFSRTACLLKMLPQRF